MYYKPAADNILAKLTWKNFINWEYMYMYILLKEIEKHFDKKEKLLIMGNSSFANMFL